jgi:hypothetical protein
VHHEQLLCLLLRSGAIEEGFQRSAMTRFIYDAGEMGLCPRHVETWIRPDDAHVLKLGISDAALMAAMKRACYEHIGAFVHKLLRRRKTDAVIIAGNECNFSLKLAHAFLLAAVFCNL